MIMPVVFHASKSDDAIFFRPIGPKWTADNTTVDDILNSEVLCAFDSTLRTYFNHPHSVAKKAITQMAQIGYQHNDLKWEHVGLLPFKKGKKWSVKPVLIDLHDVIYFKENLDDEAFTSKQTEVIETSLQKLGIEH
jgi:hypothetical protein